MIVRLNTVYGNNHINAVLGPCIENKTCIVVLPRGIYLALWDEKSLVTQASPSPMLNPKSPLY